MRFVDLPDDVLRTIVDALDNGKDRCALSSTCVCMREASREPWFYDGPSVTISSYPAMVSFGRWVRDRPHMTRMRISSLDTYANNMEVIAAIAATTARTLRHLDLRVRHSVSYPVFAEFATRLETLSLDCCGAYLDMRLPFLKELRVRDQKCGSHVAFPMRLERLERLDLVACNLRQAPTGLDRLPNLRTLVLDDNCIHVVDFGAATALTRLSLRRCKMMAMPDVSKCAMLQDLDVSCNSIAAYYDDDDSTDVFDHILGLQNVHVLNLSHNILCLDAIEQLGRMRQRPKVLDISCNVFEEMEHGSYMDGVEVLVTHVVPTKQFLTRCTTLQKINIHPLCNYSPSF